MKYLFIFILFLCILSCSENEDKLTEQLREELTSHQWVLNDTTFFYGLSEIVYSHHLLEFNDNSFKLLQKIIRISEMVNDTSMLEESGIYKIVFPKIILSFYSDDRSIYGEMDDNKLIMRNPEDPSIKSYFYKK